MATQKSFTKKQIEDAINSQMADNTSQAITASNVRSITKDYMTGSMAAPMLIYAGQITSGATAADCIIREQYYNPDFFQLQNTTNPASASNIFQANTTSLPGLNDTYAVTGINGLVAVITVSNGVLTDMTIMTQLGGFIVGEVITMLLNGNQIGFDLTYNGAIRPRDAGSVGNGSIPETHFILTENSDNTYKEHRNVNTVISTAEKSLSIGAQGDSLGFTHTEKNSLRYGTADSLAIFSSKTVFITGNSSSTSYRTQHIQLYRLPGTVTERVGFS